MSDPYRQNPPQYPAPPAPGAGFAPPEGDPGSLDLPWYGIGFIDAFKRGWKKYATFSGRASRSEYWWWTLALICVNVPLSLLAEGLVSIGAAQEDSGGNGAPLLIVGGIFGVIYLVFWLATIVPSLALGARRLHDGDRSGWFLLLVLIPFVGGIILLIWFCLGPDPAGQRFDRR